MLFDPGCAGCGCSTDLCAVYTIYGCGTGPGYELAGANVRIRTALGGTIVASGVTDSAGRVTLCVPTSGTRWVEADVPGRYNNSGSSMGTGSTDRTLTISSVVSGKCCLGLIAGSCDPPYTERGPIYLTDANGTWSPLTTCGTTWHAIAYAPAYRCSCSPREIVTEVLPIRVIYQAGWSGGSVTVTRRWIESRPASCFGEPTPALPWLPQSYPPACYDSSDAVAPLSQGSASGSGGSCASPMWSVSLTQVGGLSTDPVTGGVVLSY